MSISLALTSGLSSDSMCTISVSSLESDWGLKLREGESDLYHLFSLECSFYS